MAVGVSDSPGTQGEAGAGGGLGGTAGLTYPCRLALRAVPRWATTVVGSSGQACFG